MLLIELLLAAAAPVASVPLEPNGPWTVAYEESMCLAARKYGAKGDVVVGLRPGPLSDHLELSMEVHRWPGRLLLAGKAEVQIAPAAKHFDGAYTAFGLSRRSAQAMIVYTVNDVLDSIQEGSVVSVEAEPSGAVAVRMTNVAKLRAALSDCRNVLLKHWGVDLAALAKVAIPAKPVGKIADWITYSDYPETAVRKGERGTSNILWTIGLDGSIADCRVVGSSGVPDLDNAACRAILRRARYEPARDGAGNPIVSWQNHRVSWRAFRL